MRFPSILLCVTLALGCGSGPDAETGGTEEGLLLLPDDVFVVGEETIASGPRISGTIEAASSAVLRAEVAGSVDAVTVDVGVPVEQGRVLGRISNAGVGSSYASAKTGVASAEAQVAQAERELARARRLLEAGALAPRDVELAERQLEAARAQLDAAVAQRAAAGEQAEGTTIRSPIAGVVSQRSVSTGDVVAPGAPLFTVIEPSSLRFEGSVRAGAAGELAVGTPVTFQVTGYGDRVFHGAIARVSPAVDPATRQIPVIVSIEEQADLVAGLFAVGRVASRREDGLVVPLDAVEGSGERGTVLRLQDGVLEEVEVAVGLRDEQGERVEIESGLAEGDVVLVGAAREAEPGTPASIRKPGSEG